MAMPIECARSRTVITSDHFDDCGIAWTTSSHWKVETPLAAHVPSDLKHAAAKRASDNAHHLGHEASIGHYIGIGSAPIKCPSGESRS
jgi:hypothetical protein